MPDDEDRRKRFWHSQRWAYLNPAIGLSLTGIECALDLYRDLTGADPPAYVIVVHPTKEFVAKEHIEGGPSIVVPLAALPEELWFLAGPEGVIWSNP